MAVLITHGEGPLGPALIRELARHRIHTTVLAADVFGARRTLSREALVASAGPTGMADLLRDYEIVIDNRVLPPVRRRSGAIGLDYVRRTAALTGAAVRAGVGRYVHVSQLGQPRYHGWARRRTEEILAAPSNMAVSRVALAPLLGPEPGASTEANAIVLRMVLGRLAAVGRGSTGLLSAADAAAAVVATALDPSAPSLVLPGRAHTYRDIAAAAAAQLDRRTPPALPRGLARGVNGLVDLVTGRRLLRLPQPSFTTGGVVRADGAWPAVLLEEDVRAVIDYYQGRAVTA